jgi:hypothetical protein
VTTSARSRRLRRFVGAGVALGLLAALPALLAARPAPSDPSVSAQQVLAAIRASASRGYSGYAESHGNAAIPDVAELGSLPSLLGDTTQLRTWWTSADQWRVDQLGPTTENDTYAFPGGTWEWASSTRTATDVTAVATVRLLRAADLTPDQLGRRLATLATAPSSTVTRIGARRYAGRTTVGIEIRGGGATTVGAVDIWADRSTGVPLAVQVIAKHQSRPTIATAYLSFSPDRPKNSTDTFVPPADARTQQVDDSALRGVLGRLRPLAAPSSAAGLAESTALPGQDGVAAYADGLAQLAVISLSGSDAGSLEHDLATVTGAQDAATATPDGSVTTFSTPLVNLELLQDGRRNLLAVGTVSPATLAAAVAALRDAPPLFQPPPAFQPGFEPGSEQ